MKAFKLQAGAPFPITVTERLGGGELVFSPLLGENNRRWYTWIRAIVR